MVFQNMGDRRCLLEDTLVNDYDGLSTKLRKPSNDYSDVPGVTSCRWITAYMCFTGMILIFAVRANLVMGLVCLLPRPRDSAYWEPVNVENETDVYTNILNISEPVIANWNDKTQGLALSAYYYGSLVSPIAGGYAATKSAKYVMVATMTMSAIVTAVTPVAMTYDAYITVMLRVALGLFGGVYEPTMQHLMTSWAPKKERGKLTALTQSGKVVGNVVSFVLSGVLCSVSFLGGWTLTFYGTGILCMLWVLVLLCLVYDGPDCHPRISRAEREYIKVGVAYSQGKSVHTTVLTTPWLAMVTSLPFLACLLVKFAGAWVFNVQSSNQPMWLRDVLRFDVQKNGIFSALPYAGQFLGSITAGIAIDLVSRTRFSSTVINKATFLICLSLPAAAIFSQSFMTEREKTLAVCLTVFSATVYSAVPVGLRLVIMELAPRYTGILMGVITTVGCVPGMVAPLVTSIITAEGTAREWATVFYVCSGLYMAAALVFLLVGKSEEQSWGR